VGRVLTAMSGLFLERALLTLLMWGLLLEVFGLAVLSSQPRRFEFPYLIVLFLITMGSIILIIMRIRKKYRELF
jgi:hypothetical protein